MKLLIAVANSSCDAVVVWLTVWALRVEWDTGVLFAGHTQGFSGTLFIALIDCTRNKFFEYISQKS